MTRRLLTTTEVAEQVGLTQATVEQAIRSGDLQPAARTANDILFTKSSVESFIQGRLTRDSIPLRLPAPTTRPEWNEELEKLSAWLVELTAVLQPGTTSQPADVSPPRLSPALDFNAPPPVTAVAPAPPAAAAAAPPIAIPVPVAAVAPAAVPTAPAVAGPPATVEVIHAPPEMASSPPPVTSFRQAILLVEPIERFRLLRDIAECLAGLKGLVAARLERLELGTAVYRITYGSPPAAPAEIAAVLDPFGLSATLIDEVP